MTLNVEQIAEKYHVNFQSGDILKTCVDDANVIVDRIEQHRATLLDNVAPGSNAEITIYSNRNSQNGLRSVSLHSEDLDLVVVRVANSDGIQSKFFKRVDLKDESSRDLFFITKAKVSLGAVHPDLFRLNLMSDEELPESIYIQVDADYQSPQWNRPELRAQLTGQIYSMLS